MNTPTIVIGSLAVLYGLYTAWIRQTNPAKLGKLTAMQDRLGAYRGFWVHVLAYTVAPLLFGIALILRGLGGEGIF